MPKPVPVGCTQHAGGNGFDKMLHSALSGLNHGGLDPTPIPCEIKLHQQTRELEISFDDGQQCRLSCEYLRVFRLLPKCAATRPDQAKLQTGKKHVAIVDIQPVGNYAVKLVFDDGHDSGLYSWDYLTNSAAISKPTGRTIWRNWPAPAPAANERHAHHGQTNPFRIPDRCRSRQGA